VISGVVGYYLSVRIHSKMVYGVLHSQMEKFLDRIPVGRIINRFSRDIDEVDKKVYSYFSYLIRVNTQTLILFVTICYTVGWEVIGLIGIWLVLTLYCQGKFMNARQEYKRLVSVAKSPMISYFTDALKGMPTLRNTGDGLVKWLKGKFMHQICMIHNFGIIDETLINWFDVRIRLY
jgi:ABC-type multidrug transport system fused ATPase/permease subunit